MKNYHIRILILLLTFFPLSGYAQFSGRILESSSNKPIANATIIAEGASGVTSGKNGEFEINLNSYPSVLKISHVSYHPLEIIINSHLQSGMDIYLEPKTLNVEEVQVRGERIKRYYKGEYFYVVDYDLFGESICMIGYENNQLSKGRILLMNVNEDTLSYKPVDRPKRIYRDALGYFHLFTRDSIFQIFYDGTELNLFYPSHRDEISLELYQLKYISNSKFLFKQASPGGQAHEYYYIDTISKTRVDLNTIYNEDLYDLPMVAARYTPPVKKIPGRASKRAGAADSGNAGIGQIHRLREIYERMVFDISIIHRPVYSLVFPNIIKYRSW